MTSEYPPVRTGLPGSFGATPLSIRPPQPWDLPEEPEDQLEDDLTGDDSRLISDEAITGRRAGEVDIDSGLVRDRAIPQPLRNPAVPPPPGEGSHDHEQGHPQPVPTEPRTDAPADSSSISAPKPPVTGDRAVDEAMELVSDSFGADLDLQLQAYESAHQTLQDRLADVES
ncbi:hypothetical protein GCM10022223_42330 [Kineosporia mesophila]|uniref:Uncharacterized protein n=1 Tax=Kineosporia mesophila TaxID=566012 RepID=A0ABP6ZY91_9ACTN|nr:hypothetical protein [Kineosporia mesophila]MCD5353325.1 hypothetical protein [Kineosporia mesophila]